MTTSLLPLSGPSAARTVAGASSSPEPGVGQVWKVIEDKTRGMGIAVYATRGQGKSVFLGRVLSFHDFQQGVPLVVIDPIGGTIDGLLDVINRQPRRKRALLWSRVRYINMASQNGVVSPWPIYERADTSESLDTTARRFVEVLRRSDAALANAPIMGLNALAPLATAAGCILTALGLGITEMESLLTEPDRWQRTLSALDTVFPETGPEVAKVQQLYRLTGREQDARRQALLAKLSEITFSPAYSAMFGAGSPGICWPEVVRNRQAVLLDFRDIDNAGIKKFCLLWTYYSLITYIRQRGHGRHVPISLVIDELSYLVGSAGMNTDVLTADVDELINRIARSHSVWLTIAGQELFQLPEALRQTVLSMGSLILGQTSDPKTAEFLAHRFFPFDPGWVRKIEPIYGVVEDRTPGRFRLPPQPAVHGVTHERTTEFTHAEQDALNSQTFLKREPGHFLLGRARREGELATHLQPITVPAVHGGEYPERRRIDRIRAELMARDGVDVQTITRQIRRRLDSLPQQPDQIARGRRGPTISRDPGAS